MIRRADYTREDVRAYAETRLDEVERDIGPIIKYLKKNDIAAEIIWEWTMIIDHEIAGGDEGVADDFFAEVSAEIEGKKVSGYTIMSMSGEGSLSSQEDYFYADWRGQLSGATRGEVDPTEKQVMELDKIIDEYSPDLSFIIVYLLDSDGNRYAEVASIDEPRIYR